MRRGSVVTRGPQLRPLEESKVPARVLKSSPGQHIDVSSVTLDEDVVSPRGAPFLGLDSPKVVSEAAAQIETSFHLAPVIFRASTAPEDPPEGTMMMQSEYENW